MQLTETPRLIIREVDSTDAPFILKLVNSPGWLKFIGDRNVHNIKDAENHIQSTILDSYKKHGFGMYVVILKDSNIPVGVSGFVQRDYLDNPDIGFAILPEFERKGYSFEAAQCMINYGITKLSFKSLYAITSEQNTSSQNLLEKLKFSFQEIISPPNSNENLKLYYNKLNS